MALGGEVPSIVNGAIGKALKNNGFTPEMKLEIFADGVNKFLMRIESIADTFDSNGQLIIHEVNVIRLAEDLFKIANDGTEKAYPHIEEVTLTANQSY
jgi:hypothetical protein